MSTDHSRSLGRAVVIRRTVLGLARKELAVAAGISYPYLSEIEHGHKEPTLSTLRSIAHSLGVPASRLLSDADAIRRGESLLR